MRRLDCRKNDIEPLLEQSGVDLVYHGHSHLWYRLKTANGLPYLESSNVGNSYGGYVRGYKDRKLLPPDDPRFCNRSNYRSFGNPCDGAIGSPSLFAPLKRQGRDLPLIDSETLTVLSIFDSGTGIVSSYAFDTTKPDSAVRKFDELKLGHER